MGKASDTMRVFTLKPVQLLLQLVPRLSVRGRFQLIFKFVGVAIEIVEFAAAIVVTGVFEMWRPKHDGAVLPRCSLAGKDGPIRLALPAFPTAHKRLPRNARRFGQTHQIAERRKDV